ncbi:MAG: hypothetical protein EBR09_03925 [Proteobacteria bacterium]|nr:hypothetical protein [Pseudomonadota bacterium]
MPASWSAACKNCICIALLSFFWGTADCSTLQTERDAALADTLQKANAEKPSLLRSGHSARMSLLRNDFRDILSKEDFAAQISLESASSLVTGNQASSGFAGRLQGVYQFATNWQGDFSWYLAQSLFGSANQRQTAGELPVLDNLTLSYGKYRSVETTFGFLRDFPLLKGEAGRSIFSGIAVAIHPAFQKATAPNSGIEARIEYGLSDLSNPRTSGNSSSLQRARPHLTAKFESPPFRAKGDLALEWYSDSDGILGKVSPQRATDIFRASPLSPSEETRWRLFFLSTCFEYRPDGEDGVALTAERISNSIGASAVPAWSVEAAFSKELPTSGPAIRLRGVVQEFSSPSGTIPQVRLPILINAGTRGTSLKTEIEWNPTTENHSAISLSFGRHEEKVSGNPVPTHCSAGTDWSPRTKSCRTLWINLAWALKLPTKL